VKLRSSCAQRFLSLISLLQLVSLLSVAEDVEAEGEDQADDNEATPDDQQIAQAIDKENPVVERDIKGHCELLL
jgi:hypothetical protein